MRLRGHVTTYFNIWVIAFKQIENSHVNKEKSFGLQILLGISHLHLSLSLQSTSSRDFLVNQQKYHRCYFDTHQIFPNNCKLTCKVGDINLYLKHPLAQMHHYQKNKKKSILKKGKNISFNFQNFIVDKKINSQDPNHNWLRLRALAFWRFVVERSWFFFFGLYIGVDQQNWIAQLPTKLKNLSSFPTQPWLYSFLSSREMILISHRLLASARQQDVCDNDFAMSPGPPQKDFEGESLVEILFYFLFFIWDSSKFQQLDTQDDMACVRFFLIIFVFENYPIISF